MNDTDSRFCFRFKWLGCACFEMDFGGVTVVSDPWITANQKTELTWKAVDACDYIAVTHGHYDHILDIPALMEKFQPRVLCGDHTAIPLMKWVDCNPMAVYPMAHGVELDLDKVKVQALFGRHSVLPGTVNERIESFKTHHVVGGDPLLQELFFWGDVEYRNFLFTLPNGKKILLWGNPLNQPEQRNAVLAAKPDVLLLQMTNPRTAPIAAQLCAQMGCQVLIPHHTDFPKDYSQVVEALQKELAQHAPNTQCILPQYGEWISL